MFDPVTGSSCGNGIQITTNTRYVSARRLTTSPARPTVKGPGCGAFPKIRRIATKVIGGIYETHSAMACSEIIALNAVDEPM
jgi:hypothetical protein